MSHVKVVTSLLKESAGLSGLRFASLVQWNIDPAAELAGFVPYRLSVPNENDSVGRLFFDKLVSTSSLKIPKSWLAES